MFGPRIVRAFETVKDAFDPIGLLNPNRITRPPRMDDRTLFRYGPGYGAISDFTPKLDWSEHPGPLGGMLGAVEMCNNNGTCRGFDSGVMCPSYRVTRDETHLTRGRANTLRLALTGQLGADAMTSDAMADAMALCVSCKACRRECPTGVDMAKMKIEVTAARDRAVRDEVARDADRGTPAICAVCVADAGAGQSAEPFAAVALADGACAWGCPPLAGCRHGAATSSWTGRQPRRAPASPSGEVYLLADTFNRYFEPENLRAAVKVLAAAGYRAVMPKTDGRPLCCGRTWLAAGLVDKAREEAARTMRFCPGICR